MKKNLLLICLIFLLLPGICFSKCNIKDTEESINIYYLWVGKSPWIQTPEDASSFIKNIDDKKLQVNNRKIHLHFKQINQAINKDVFNVYDLMEKHIDDLYPPESGYPDQLNDSIKTLFNHFDKMNYFFLISCMNDKFFFQTLLYHKNEVQPFGKVYVNTQEKINANAIKSLNKKIEKCLAKQLAIRFPQIDCDFVLQLESDHYKTIPFPSLIIKLIINGKWFNDYKCSESGSVSLTKIPYNMKNSYLYINPEKYESDDKEKRFKSDEFDKKWLQTCYTKIHMGTQFWDKIQNGINPYIIPIPQKNPEGKPNYYSRPIKIQFVTPTQIIAIEELNCRFKKNEFIIHNTTGNKITRLRGEAEEWELSIPDNINTLPSDIVQSWKRTIEFDTDQDFIITAPFNWVEYIRREVKECDKQIDYFENILKGKSPITCCQNVNKEQCCKHNKCCPNINKDGLDNIGQAIVSVTESCRDNACHLSETAINSKMLKNNFDKLKLYRYLVCYCHKEIYKLDAQGLLLQLREDVQLETNQSFDCLR